MNLYVMYTFENMKTKTFLAAGEDCMKAAANVVDAFGVEEKYLSVSQDVEITPNFVASVDTQFGGISLKQKSVNIDAQQQRFRAVVELIDHAIEIAEGPGDWEVKYDSVFDMKIEEAVKLTGLLLERFDPDTSYEEDLKAYISDLKTFKKKVQDLIQG